MSAKAESKRYYRRCLPHYRLAGGIYHVRFSTHAGRRLTDDWMFEVVEEALLHRHKKLLLLHAYEIMANHLHAVMEPLSMSQSRGGCSDFSGYFSLGFIIKGIKTYTAQRVNRRQGRFASLWEKEYFDRTVRDERDYVEVIDYIHHNAVRWGLVRFPQDYRWSSLRTIYSGAPEYRGWFNIRPEA